MKSKLLVAAIAATPFSQPCAATTFRQPDFGEWLKDTPPQQLHSKVLLLG
jgi:hypothetical protein